MKSIVTDFGADPSGMTDSFSAIQAALDAGGASECPAGRYVLSAELFMRRPATLAGEGGDVSNFVTSANIGLTMMRNPIYGMDGFAVEGIHFSPEMPNGGQSAIRFATVAPGTMLRKPRIERCVISPFGGAGILSVNTQQDGLVAAKIVDNRISNGIMLNSPGDSIEILGNLIFGLGIGIFASFDPTVVPGASSLSIVGNNITCDREPIYLVDAKNTRISSNQMELINGYSGTTDSMVFLQRCVEGIVGPVNNINAHGHTNGVRLLDCIHTEVSEDTITVAQGHKHVWETGGASNEKLDNLFQDPAIGEVSGYF